MKEFLKKITEKISALPLDKVLHFFIGGVIMMILFSLSPAIQGVDEYFKWSCIWTFFLFILCASKEIVDVIRDGSIKSFDYLDLVTGVLGGWGYLLLNGLLLLLNLHVQ